MITYADVAEVIARAETPEEREEARLMMAAYYRFSPEIEPLAERWRILQRALEAAIARKGG